MIRRRAVPIAVLAMLQLACGDTEGPASEAAVRDSAGIRIVENLTTDGASCTVGALPSLDLGQVEGPSEYQFYRVFDAATLSDGRIAVLDQGSSQIRLFSPDGVFERAFGSEGGGPGEFNNLFQLWVMPGDTLVVGDYRPWRFSTFTSEGEYLRAVVPEPMYPNVPASMTPMTDGSYVLAERCCPFTGEEGEWLDQELHVVRHAADGSLIDTLAVLPNGRHGWLDVEIRFGGTPVFEATSRVAARGSRVVFGRGVERQLEVYTVAPGVATEAGGDVERIDVSRPTGLIRWTGDDREVTEAQVDAYRRAERERYAGQDLPPPIRQSIEAMVSEDRPVADRFPAHAGIMIGIEGDIWVHEYPRPIEGELGWLVFDEEGRFECRVTLPLDSVYEIGPDYVLGKAEDEFEVEHIVRYPLTRPGR